MTVRILRLKHPIKHEQEPMPNGDVIEFKRPLGLPKSTSNQMLLTAVKMSSLGAKETVLSELLGVHTSAITHWINTPEWKQLRRNVDPEIKAFISTRLQDLATVALEQLADRLEHGERLQRREKIKRVDAHGHEETVEEFVRLAFQYAVTNNLAFEFVESMFDMINQAGFIFFTSIF